VDPLLVFTAGARGSTHKTTIFALKNLYMIPKTLIEPMVSQLNTVAIKYAMNILLYKKKIRKQPTIINSTKLEQLRNSGNNLTITLQKARYCRYLYSSLISSFHFLPPPLYPTPFYRVHPSSRANSSYVYSQCAIVVEPCTKGDFIHARTSSGPRVLLLLL
jgi:hypothetical protein